MMRFLRYLIDLFGACRHPQSELLWPRKDYIDGTTYQVCLVCCQRVPYIGALASPLPLVTGQHRPNGAGRVSSEAR